MAYHHTWFGSSKIYICNNVGELWDQWKTALNSTLQLACDKSVFSAHVQSLFKWRAQCNGVGFDFQENFFNWICDLLTISLSLQKSYEEFGQALDMLVDALRQVGLVPNAGKTKITSSRTCISRRDSSGNFGTRPCTQMVGMYE